MKGQWVRKQFFLLCAVVAMLFSAGESLAVEPGAKVKLTVTKKTTTSKDRSESIKLRGEDGDDELTIFTDVEKEVCTLTINVKPAAPSAPCRLEWYFISEKAKTINVNKTTKIVKEDCNIFNSGGKEIALTDTAPIQETVISPEFVSTITSYDNGKDDKFIKNSYAGYVVLVKQDGKIIAQASNSSKFLKDEWLEKFK